METTPDAPQPTRAAGPPRWVVVATGTATLATLISAGWVAADRITDPPGPCGAVEHPRDLGAAHLDDGQPPPTYSSHPPTSGPHSHEATAPGTIYRSPRPLPELVHAMEHGTVIFWVAEGDAGMHRRAGEIANEIFDRGYWSLILVPISGMPEPFAMTTWGTLQRCSAPDRDAMHAFVDAFYGSGPEGAFACQGEAARLPACSTVGA